MQVLEGIATVEVSIGGLLLLVSNNDSDDAVNDKKSWLISYGSYDLKL